MTLVMNHHLRGRLVRAVLTEPNWSQEFRVRWVERVSAVPDGDEAVFITKFDDENDWTLAALVDVLGLTPWADVLDADRCAAVGVELHTDDGRAPLVRALLTDAERATLRRWEASR